MVKLTVGIAGLGLIGGSFAKDLIAKQHGIVGYDTDEKTCKQAMQEGIVHQAATDIKVLDDCEAILIAVPVRTIKTVMQQIAELDCARLKAVFDAGSTKVKPIEWSSELGKYAKFFVAAHPIAGIEHSGIDHAKQGLFKDKRLIICEPVQDQDALAITKSLWEDCGALIHLMDATEHDQIFAAVSHLPHVLAYLLVGMLGQRSEKRSILRFCCERV